MLVRAELHEILHGDRGMIQGIRACLDRECLVSSVTLIYAMIDALAALTRPMTEAKTSGAIFRDWVKDYMSHKELGCTPTDLWGARCGVLHLYSPESDYSLQGRANRLYYQWSQGPAANSSVDLPKGSLTINIEDLFASAVAAADRFADAADNDSSVGNSVKHHLQQLLCYKPFTTLAHAHAA